MKKMCLLMEIIIIPFLLTAQSTRLTLKFSIPVEELYYWPLDGKFLPYYDLGIVCYTNDQRMLTLAPEINDPTIFHISADNTLFKIYLTPGCSDTLIIKDGVTSFKGTNKLHNETLALLEKSEDYYNSFIYYSGHPLEKINYLQEFRDTLLTRRQSDEKLLENNELSPFFITQQKECIKMRYYSLFLKKMVTIDYTSESSKEWINAFQEISPPIDSPSALIFPYFNEIMEDYVCIEEFIILKNNPEKYWESFNSFLFQKYCNLLKGDHLEFALAYLIRNDSFQQNFSKDIPGLYNQFLNLFPQSVYRGILEPEVKNTTKFHQVAKENEKIRFMENSAAIQDLEDILKPFKGKVVYADIWATWCGPCLRMFSHIEKLKAKTNHLDIVYLYISFDKDKDEEKWKKMACYFNLEGYHFRVNAQQDASIRALYGNSGSISFPSYLMIDREGNIQNLHAASPDDPEKVVEQLNTLLQ